MVRSGRPGAPGTWRFGLECVQMGEKGAFDDLEELAAWLRKALNRDAEDHALDALVDG